MNTGKISDMGFFRFSDGIVVGCGLAWPRVNVLVSLIFSGMTGSAMANDTGVGVLLEIARDGSARGTMTWLQLCYNSSISYNWAHLPPQYDHVVVLVTGYRSFRRSAAYGRYAAGGYCLR